MEQGIKCYRCGKINSASESKKVKIIYRGHNYTTGKTVLKDESLDFCKDGPCASHEQMSREG